MRPSRLVLLHGFTQGGGIWLPVIERLTTRCAIDAPDLPGHGAASETKTSLPETADDLAATFGEGAWVGYSMGGRVALHVALRHPELVSHLVLCSATAGIPDLSERAARRRSDDQLAARVRSIGVDRFLDEWLAQPMFASLANSRTSAPHDTEVRRANTADGLARSLELAGTGTQASLWDELPRLDMPVLVVTGEIDTKFTAIGSDMARAIGSNAQHVVVARSGHSVPFEAPHEFAMLLDEFIA